MTGVSSFLDKCCKPVEKNTLYMITLYHTGTPSSKCLQILPLFTFCRLRDNHTFVWAHIKVYRAIKDDGCVSSSYFFLDKCCETPAQKSDQSGKFVTINRDEWLSPCLSRSRCGQMGVKCQRWIGVKEYERPRIQIWDDEKVFGQQCCLPICE